MAKSTVQRIGWLTLYKEEDAKRKQRKPRNIQVVDMAMAETIGDEILSDFSEILRAACSVDRPRTACSVDRPRTACSGDRPRAACSGDRPIYVRAACSGKYKPENLWYVIEEKPRNRCDDTEGLLCYSDSDYIRRISVPDSDVQDTSLAVLGSRIYLIGGDIDTAMKNEDKENIGYKHFELGQNPEWVLGGGKLLSAQFGAAAVGRDGFIYSVGCNQYRLCPDTGILKQLPVTASLIRQINRKPYQSHLLALTKSKLFIYVTVSLDAPNLMLSYDLGTGKWDEGYDGISGKWSAGVVLYDDRYLFAFGTQNPMSLPATMSMKPVQKVVPGIYVFDIQQRKWLPEPVKGLRTDGITLPHVYETHDYESEADMYEAGPGYTPYLFQVGKENNHKLALLWDTERPNPESGLPQCLLYWSKFVLSPITIGTATVDPHFYVSSLSNGFTVLDEGTYRLLNCAAGMDTAIPDQRDFEFNDAVTELI